MGWRPWEVRQTTLQDFAAASEGWARAQGIDLGPSEDDVRALDDLMARYPDKPRKGAG